jgi:hypothetical protein
MEDRATVSPNGPDPRKPGQLTAYITTAAGTVRHFSDAGRLADWLAAHPSFPHQDVLEQFLAALDSRPARNPHPPVDDTLAMVVRINQEAHA